MQTAYACGSSSQLNNFFKSFSSAVFDTMNGKYTKQKCSLCSCNFQGRRHCDPESWCPSVCSFFEQETGLVVGNRELCVCGACNV